MISKQHDNYQLKLKEKKENKTAAAVKPGQEGGAEPCRPPALPWAEGGWGGSWAGQ